MEGLCHDRRGCSPSSCGLSSPGRTTGRERSDQGGSEVRDAVEEYTAEVLEEVERAQEAYEWTYPGAPASIFRSWSTTRSQLAVVAEWAVSEGPFVS